jgi:protein-S-isoprenylcysteine O-methyltransferase Ste14
MEPHTIKNCSVNTVQYSEKLTEKVSVGWLSMLLADIALIWGAFTLYSINQWYVDFLESKAMLLLTITAIVFTVARVVANITGRNEIDIKPSPGYTFFKTIANGVKSVVFKKANTASPGLFASEDEKRTFLFTLVKLFFIPVMLQFAVNNCNELSAEIGRVIKHGVDRDFYLYFNNVIYPLGITLFFLIDTWLFSFGYLFESRRLKNKLRSVDSTWSGWIVALICYPPFNEILTKFAPQTNSMYAYFDSSYKATFVLRVVCFVLLFIYMWASLSLGTRCSNLTNRGIVTTGAYKFVRHPAYISKVTVWWLTMIPFLQGSYYAVFGMLTWTVVYFLRAVTEERHLSKDPDYLSYCERVKYRFIPYVY